MARIGSFCSCIGGLELALELLGVGETVWQVEVNEFRQTILAKNFPHAARFADVRAVRGGRELTPVDIITSGHPCQPYAKGGHRRGAGDDRHLWPDIADRLGELLPAAFFMENVSALVRFDDGRVFGEHLRRLAALGYDATWDCFSGRGSGASHLRDRVYLLALRPAVADADCERLALWAGLREDLQPQQPPAARGRGPRRGDGAVSAGEALAQSRVGRASHGVPGWVDEDGAVMPFTAARGMPQHPGEPARVVRRHPAQGPRISALGEAVIPAVAARAWRTLLRRMLDVKARAWRRQGGGVQ